jgi:hypothetical protein
MESQNNQFIEKQIDLHISEYNALTTRHTYYINMQIGLLAAGIGAGLIVVSIWKENYSFIFIWGLILIWQIINFLFVFNVYDSYRIVAYIESVLKPKIRDLINNSNFWEYETVLSKNRGMGHRFLELSNVLVIFLIILFGVLYRFCNWLLWDWIGLIINFILLIFPTRLTILSMKIRKNNWIFVKR